MDARTYRNCDAALKYIRHIRNENKRDYATRFAIWLARSPEERKVIVEPIPHSLGAMAAQAVRNNLYRFMREQDNGDMLWTGDH